jgi:hypothetical protein
MHETSRFVVETRPAPDAASSSAGNFKPNKPAPIRNVSRRDKENTFLDSQQACHPSGDWPRTMYR